MSANYYALSFAIKTRAEACWMRYFPSLPSQAVVGPNYAGRRLEGLEFFPVTNDTITDIGYDMVKNNSGSWMGMTKIIYDFGMQWSLEIRSHSTRRYFIMIGNMLTRNNSCWTNSAGFVV